MVEITASYPAGVIATTRENLAAAAAGENEEWTELYPEFARVADEEGFPAVAATFRFISKVEPSRMPATGLCSHASRRTRCSSATRRSNGSAVTAGMCTRARTRPRCARRAAIPRPISNRRRTTTKRGEASDLGAASRTQGGGAILRFFSSGRRFAGAASLIRAGSAAQGKACGRSRSILGLRTVCIAWETGPCAA